MRNKYLRFADVLFLLSFVAGTTMTACSEQPYQPTLKATYNKPAKNWESEALPIGNGYMGAMIFGDVYVDVIQTNEHTLWSGGPGEDPSYNGGHLRTPEVNKDYLHKARVMLQQKMNDFTANRSAYIDENGKLIWECPNCGNQDQDKLFVARRTCGYIGTQFWNQGRTQEIKDRVLHL